LGLQVKQKEDGIFISQDKYVAKILRKFGFTHVKSASTLVDTKKPLLKDSDGDDVDVHLYRSMIGSLMYLTSSRPDIMILKGQPKLGLWYPRDSPFDLVEYSDSDYAGASLDRKSTIKGCQFLGCRLISWQCKKQTVVATSSTEAEYVVVANAEGISTLPTTEIFDQLALMGAQLFRAYLFRVKDQPSQQETVVPQPSSPPHIHVTDDAVSFGEDDRMDPIHDNTSCNWFPRNKSAGGLGCYVTIGDTLVQTRSERVFTIPSDLPLPRVNTLRSDEGSIKLQELMVLCTTLSKKVESLETGLKQTKNIYGAAYTKLIKKVKKLEKTIKSSQTRRRAKMVVSEDEEGSDSDILAQEDPSKQGRKIAQINEDEGNTLIQMGAQTQGRYGKDSTASTYFTTVNVPVITAGAEISTTGAEVSTASPEVKTAGDFGDNIVAETLVYIRRSAAKAKEKGKGIMEESESAMTKTKRKQEQERLGFEAAVRLQAELNEEERQRITRLVQRLQVEEREKYTEAEQARMLAELINQRKRYFAAQKAEAKRNKPMTQARQRTYMSNYIKHMGNYKLQQLKRLTFDEIKDLFETTMRRVNTFVPMETKDRIGVPELVADSSQAAVTESTEAGGTKRAAEEEELGQQSSKKQKPDELSQVELQQLMIIVLKEGMNIKALQTKYLIID
ncbi:hypothetical protein Tco_0260920, partial [Tanacetum coccineum]